MTRHAAPCLFIGLGLGLVATLGLAATAHASVGLVCEGVDTDTRMSAVLGAGPIRTPLAVTLEVAGHERRTVGPAAPSADALVIGQSWLDRSEFRLDLLDVEGRRFEARLRARSLKDGPALATGTLATGTLVLGAGRVVEVECREG